MRPTGTPAAMFSLGGTLPAARWRATMGVSMTDGAMLLTVTPHLANSGATVLPNAITPPFDAA